MPVLAQTSRAALEIACVQDFTVSGRVESRENDQLPSPYARKQPGGLEGTDRAGISRSGSDLTGGIALAVSTSESDPVLSIGMGATAAPTAVSGSGELGPPSSSVGSVELLEAERCSEGEEGTLSRSASDVADDIALVVAMGGDA